MSVESTQKEVIRSKLACDAGSIVIAALLLGALAIGVASSDIGYEFPAISVLVCGSAIGALLLCPPVAVVAGIVALVRIRRSDGQLEGRSAAWTGILLGAATWLLIGLAAPSFMKARSHSQYNACICVLACADSAKEQWALEYSKNAGAQVTRADIYPYIKNAEEHFRCPKMKIDTYSVGAIGESPRCTFHGSLAESREKAASRK